VEISILNFAIPCVAGNKEGLSFQHKQKQEETIIHSLETLSCMKNKSEESATSIMILETGKIELRNLEVQTSYILQLRQ